MSLNLAKLAYPVTTLGPGKRLVIWTAGCPLRCKGCITPELLSADSGQLITIDHLVQHIKKLPIQLDGLTLSGGEPFVQANTLTKFCQQILQSFPNWNILAFSGYPLSYLQQHKKYQTLLSVLDILIAGPYLQQQAIAHPLIASQNQTLHYLTPRAHQLKPSINNLPNQQANLGLSTNQTQSLIGIITPDTRQQLHHALNLQDC